MSTWLKRILCNGKNQNQSTNQASRKAKGKANRAGRSTQNSQPEGSINLTFSPEEAFRKIPWSSQSSPNISQSLFTVPHKQTTPGRPKLSRRKPKKVRQGSVATWTSVAQDRSREMWLAPVEQVGGNSGLRGRKTNANVFCPLPLNYLFIYSFINK